MCIEIARSSDEPMLISSCGTTRNRLLATALFSVQPSNMSDQCWRALQCFALLSHYNEGECDDYCRRQRCRLIVKNHCPDDLMFVRSVPVLHDHLYFAYDETYFDTDDPVVGYPPEYVCHSQEFSMSVFTLRCCFHG